MNDKLRIMNYYTDRAVANEHGSIIDVADDILSNNLYLCRGLYLKPTATNIFDTKLERNAVMEREYLFAMDYMSYLLSAYDITKKIVYKQKFHEILDQFFEYCERTSLELSVYDDLIPYAQSVMLIKALHLLPDVPHINKIIELLYKHALYCRDDKNHWDDNNHGLFTDLGLLHLAVLFESLPQSSEWKTHAVKRVNALFAVSFYHDGWNSEQSIAYFAHNLIMYEAILNFCKYYSIQGVEGINHKIAKSHHVFETFAHNDNSYPIIGDGSITHSALHNDESGIFTDAGIAVVKIENMYCTFKCKTELQFHAHLDDTSITVRYRDINILLDSGQFSYDRYNPINKFVRSISGHSCICPVFLDGLSLGEYLSRRNHAGIEGFEMNGDCGVVRGGYELDEGDIKVYREVKIEPLCVTVKDSWENKMPVTMRQRFVLPRIFFDKSNFAYAKKSFETQVEDLSVKYEIVSNVDNLFTCVNFGVMCKRNFEYEPTLLLDSIAENSLKGEITSIISIKELD